MVEHGSRTYMPARTTTTSTPAASAATAAIEIVDCNASARNSLL
jgi:hypothetical protein